MSYLVRRNLLRCRLLQTEAAVAQHALVIRFMLYILCDICTLYQPFISSVSHIETCQSHVLLLFVYHVLK